MPGTAERLKELVQAAIDYKGQRRVITRQYLFPLLARFTPVVAAEHAFDEELWYYVSTSDQVVATSSAEVAMSATSSNRP